MIKAVIFDFGDTLALSNHARKSIDHVGLGWTIFKHNGFPGRKTDYLVARKKADKIYSLQKSEKHKPGHYYSVIASEANWKIPFSLCKKMDDEYYEIFIQLLTLDPDGVRLIKTLKKKGYFVGIISNGHRRNVIPILRRYRLDKSFDTILISFDIKSQKNELKPFKKLLRDYRFSPKEVLMVGDRLDEDIRAGELGIHTAWIKREKRYQSGIERKPDYTVTSLREVERIIDIINNR